MCTFLSNADLWNNVLGTIIGGLAFTLILFILNELVFPKINLTGEWTAVLKIKKTTYKPYENLAIEYKLHILQKGNELIGSGEKIKDINTDGSQTIFQPEKRVQIEINGYYRKKYFSKSKVYLNIFEEGRNRESRSTYILNVDEDKKLKGVFTSTAANSEGDVEIIKA